MFKRSLKTEKGFTLAELLIVVAILAVLAAIAIPLFSIQLEKGREATDIANVRGAYAEVMNAATLEDETLADCTFDNGVYSKSVSLTQKENGWQTKLPITIAGIHSESSENGTDADSHWIGKPASGGSCKVEFNTATKEVFFYWNGSGSSGSGGGTTDTPDQPNNPGSNNPPADGSGWAEPGTTLSSTGIDKSWKAASITSPVDNTIKILVKVKKGNGAGSEIVDKEMTLTADNKTGTINFEKSNANNKIISITLISGDLSNKQFEELKNSIKEVKID